MKAFISSTSIDLREHRRATAEALERLGNATGRMEVFGAQPIEPRVASLRELAGCHLFIGIYAHRYGFIPDGSGKSITEDEFDFAMNAAKPMFCFIVNDEYPWSPKMIDDDSKYRKLTSFKERITRVLTVDFFTTPDDLSVKVATSVGRYLTRERFKNTAGQLQNFMREADLSAQRLAEGHTLSDVKEEDRNRIKQLIEELSAIVDNIQPRPQETVDLDALLTFAKGLLSAGRWLDAAQELEEYALRRPDDWETSYLRGVAYANVRGDHRTNLRALRACNDTITFAPTDIDPNIRARLFAYRGAMLKRLNRLDEAESDLRLANSYATGEYERADIIYNLAGVYAMRGDRERLMQCVKKLEEDEIYLLAIRGHLRDYFSKFSSDTEFLRAVGLATHSGGTESPKRMS